MVVLMVVLTIVVFIVIDVSSRIALQKYQEKKLRRAREKALDVGLRLDYTDEAPSLKRVAVDHPKARILAVDDEAVVLDSFRKILVIAGYAVDTVETGQEALGLVRKYDYDFVFTDLKMPAMDGVDVVKAVKHLRPDVDVIVVTGFASIETAVETMKHGAMDYVQKPFTADELIAFVNTSLIRRRDRIERQMKPRVHLITPSSGASASKHTFNVPSGVFVAPTHTWVRLALNGMLMVGLDDFALKLIGEIDGVELPEVGRRVAKDEPLFTVRHGRHALTFPAPVGGRVAAVNTPLLDRPELMTLKPYELGWLCDLDPANLPADLQTLRVGADAVAWYQQEIDRFFTVMHALESTDRHEPAPDEAALQRDGRWEAFERAFLDDNTGVAH